MKNSHSARFNSHQPSPRDFFGTNFNRYVTRTFVGFLGLLMILIALGVSSYRHVSAQSPDGGAEIAGPIERTSTKGRLPSSVGNPGLEGKPGPVAPANDLIGSRSYSFTSGYAKPDDMDPRAMELVGPGQDDISSVLADIGFDFWLDGIRYSQFSVNSNGLVRLGTQVVDAGGSGRNSNFATATDNPKLSAYWTDQCTANDGKIHYWVSGVPGTRKLTIEFLHLTRFDPAVGQCTAKGNNSFQVWLFESSGAIQFVYANTLPVNEEGFSAGIGSSRTSFATIDAKAGLNDFGKSHANGKAGIVGNTSFTYTPASAPAPSQLEFQNIAPTALRLRWRDNASNEFGYAIYRSNDGENYSFLAQIAADQTSYEDRELAAGTNYSYRVFALTAGSLSEPLSGTRPTAVAAEDTCNGAGGNWGAPGTWADGTVPTSGDNVTIGSGCIVTIDTAAEAINVTVQNGGILQWEASAARSLMVANVTIASGGTFQSAASGGVSTHQLSVRGDLTNNGNLDFSTNGNIAGATIALIGGAGSSNFSLGASSTTDLRAVSVAKNVASNEVLFSAGGTLTVQGANTSGFLSILSGTFHLGGTGTFSNPLFAVAAYSIPATGGFRLNNPNATVVGQNGSSNVSGTFRISQGSFGIGALQSDSMVFNANCTVTIEGGSVTATGKFGIGVANTPIAYTQTGGIVTVSTLGNNSSQIASFDLGTAPGSVVNISGGTIVLQRSTGTFFAPDYRHQAGTSGVSSVTGGTLQIGNASTNTVGRQFYLSGVMPNVIVSNEFPNVVGTCLVPTSFNNSSLNLTINSGATFSLGQSPFVLMGTTLTNNGTLTQSSDSTLVFALTTAPVLYTGPGTVGPLSNLSIQSDLGLTFDASSANIRVLNLRLFAGNVGGADHLTVGVGNNTQNIVQIGNPTTPTPAGTFDSQLGYNPSTAGIKLMYLRTTTSRTTGFEIPSPSRSVTDFTYDDNGAGHTLTIDGGDLTLITAETAPAAVRLTNGRLVTGNNKFSVINPGNNVQRVNGYVDGNFQKRVAFLGPRTFEVGTANGYSPFVLTNPTPNTILSMTVRAVEGTEPHVLDSAKALKRYWVVSGATGTSNLTFNYLDPTDIPTTANEANFAITRYDSGPAQPGGTVNPAANSASITGVTSVSTNWTLAEPSAVFTAGQLQFDHPTYTVNEPGPTATITVNMPAGSAGAAGVSYATVAGGTAIGGANCGAGIDFVNTSGTLNFPNGVTSQTFDVPICNDGLHENTETINVQLSNPTGGGTLGGQSNAILSIVDDDPQVFGTVSISDAKLREGNSGNNTQMTFMVTYTPPSDGSNPCAIISLSTANGTATLADNDYSAANGFQMGFGDCGALHRSQAVTETAIFNVGILGDLKKEANETLFVTLNNPENVNIGDGQGVGIIVDDDRPYLSDFDNDKKSDLSVFRSSAGDWYSLFTTGAFEARHFGAAGDLAVPGDYDGDGKTDKAVFRPSASSWYIEFSSDLSFHATQWGAASDLPVQGDYDGDGKTDLGVFRAGNWYILLSATSSLRSVQFGSPGDLPVAGDYDGDNITDVAVFRSGSWYLLRSSTGAFISQAWGASGDVPVVGDFDGDGSVDFTVYRDGTWYVLQSLTSTLRTVNFGIGTDRPVAADYDGDGTSDIAVFRASTGYWYALRSSDKVFTANQWGQNGDVPVPAAYLPQ